MAEMGPPVQAAAIAAFRKAVLSYYREHRRDLPWRRTRDPYAILVSEVMLQQTQVARVAAKYADFLAAFPTAVTLSRAPAADVLACWQGLGYNRRALNLHETACIIVAEYGGAVPRTVPELRRLPGVGRSTAAAVCAFAYDHPAPFIETNIRSAFIHFFFQECASVRDAEILPLIEKTLDRENPRDWFYALMDFGAWTKKAFPNPSRRSRHHVKQTPFEGSHRQSRAAVLRRLLAVAPAGMTAVEIHSAPTDLSWLGIAEIDAVLEELTDEGFLVRRDERYSVA